MPELNFEIYGAEPLPYAAAPQLVFKIGITNTPAGEALHTIALRCQIQIEAAQRRYNLQEQERLRDLFDTPARWSKTLRTMLWTHASVIVKPFTGHTTVDLPVACTFDFNLAATKYFAGLEEGEIPLLLQFSGTIFYAGEHGILQVGQIPWTLEVKYRLPVSVWKAMMEHYYPNSAWLMLRRDVFDRLHTYKVQRGIPTWEQTLEKLLPPDEN